MRGKLSQLWQRRLHVVLCSNLGTVPGIELGTLWLKGRGLTNCATVQFSGTTAMLRYYCILCQRFFIEFILLGVKYMRLEKAVDYKTFLKLISVGNKIRKQLLLAATKC